MADPPTYAYASFDFSHYLKLFNSDGTTVISDTTGAWFTYIRNNIDDYETCQYSTDYGQTYTSQTDTINWPNTSDSHWSSNYQGLYRDDKMWIPRSSDYPEA